MEFLRPRKPGEPSCHCKMRMSGLCKVEMSAFMVGRGRHGHGANRLESTRTGAAAGATRGQAEADHADRSRQAAEGQRSSHTSAAPSALHELGIEWIAAHSPQAKGRIERLFETLQDRLLKEMRLMGIDSIQAANHFLEMRFLPEWERRFSVAPRNPRNAHRRLDREQRLEEILSVRVVRKVTDDHTVSWDGNRWGVPREEVCAGLRDAQVEIERRLDGSHWLRFRGRYLRLRHCPEPASRAVTPSGLRPPGVTANRLART